MNKDTALINKILVAAGVAVILLQSLVYYRYISLGNESYTVYQYLGWLAMAFSIMVPMGKNTSLKWLKVAFAWVALGLMIANYYQLRPLL